MFGNKYVWNYFVVIVCAMNILAGLVWAAIPEPSRCLEESRIALQWVNRSSQEIEIEALRIAPEKMRAKTVLWKWRKGDLLHNRFLGYYNAEEESGNNRPMVDIVCSDGIYTNCLQGVRYVEAAISKDEVAEGKQKCIYSNRYAAGFLDGYVSVIPRHALSVIDLAMNGNPVAKEDIKDGKPCVLVESTSGGYQTVKLWIIPEKEYNLAGYMLEYKSQSVNEEYRRASIVMDQVEYMEVDGKTIVAAAKYSVYCELQDGAIESYEMTARRRKVDFNPKFDEKGVFSHEHIPNGTWVIGDDWAKTGIKYVWDHGEVVPLSDSKTVQGIKREIGKHLKTTSATLPSPSSQASAQGSDRRGGGLIWMGVGLIALLTVAGGGIYWWKRGKHA